jgi:hypothetical protein
MANPTSYPLLLRPKRCCLKRQVIRSIYQLPFVTPVLRGCTVVDGGWWGLGFGTVYEVGGGVGLWEGFKAS